MNITSIMETIHKKIKTFFQSIPIHYILIIIALIIIAIIAGVLLLGGETDDTPPSLKVLTKDTTVYEGENVTIKVNFSDNDRVSSAFLFYKRDSDENFSKISIINKTATISIPSGSGEDWEYYVTVNDPAKNGPVGDPSTNGSKTYRIDVLRKSNGGDDSSSGYKRAVFVEEFSSKTCHNCPEVSESLHELFNEYGNGTYQFQYVTIIGDNTNDDTKSRLQAYNVVGYPLVIVDGGYEALYGQKEKLAYADAIQTAAERTTPDITINLTTSYVEADSQIRLEIDVYNNESTDYTGRLRVYLAEVLSTKYQDEEGKTYRNAFLEFAINKDITVPSKGEKTETKTLSSDEFNPENLMVYAVMFSKEKHQTSYSQDVDEQNYPFDAYYVDGCVGVRVVEGGNLPPSINIEFPKDGKVYFFGRQINLLDAFTFNKTFLFGRCNFTVQANDNDGIDKVELYIDGILTQTFTTEPYEFTYTNSKIFKFKHTVRFVAYDTKGQSASSSLDIFALTL